MTLLCISCVASKESFHSPLWPSVSPSIKRGRYEPLAERLARSCEGREEIVLYLSVKVTAIPCPVQSGCFGSFSLGLDVVTQQAIEAQTATMSCLHLVNASHGETSYLCLPACSRGEKRGEEWGADGRPRPETCMRGLFSVTIGLLVLVVRSVREQRLWIQSSPLCS